MNYKPGMRFVHKAFGNAKGVITSIGPLYIRFQYDYDIYSFEVLIEVFDKYFTPINSIKKKSKPTWL